MYTCIHSSLTHPYYSFSILSPLQFLNSFFHSSQTHLHPFSHSSLAPQSISSPSFLIPKHSILVTLPPLLSHIPPFPLVLLLNYPLYPSFPIPKYPVLVTHLTLPHPYSSIHPSLTPKLSLIHAFSSPVLHSSCPFSFSLPILLHSP